MEKRCNRCEQIKSHDYFSVSRSNKDGYTTLCKQCVCLRNKEYWRTSLGRLSQLFAVQVYNSKQRGHHAPAYSKKELLEWVTKNGWEILFTNWQESGYDTNLIPSIDREDPNLGYTLTNIRAVTWAENNEKAYEDRKLCKHITKQNRRVEQLSLDSKHIAYFDSIASASRSTGVQRTNINAMCNGRSQYKSVGGFLWQHA